jgi:hypothetical protein
MVKASVLNFFMAQGLKVKYRQPIMTAGPKINHAIFKEPDRISNKRKATIGWNHVFDQGINVGLNAGCGN